MGWLRFAWVGVRVGDAGSVEVAVVLGVVDGVAVATAFVKTWALKASSGRFIPLGSIRLI